METHSSGSMPDGAAREQLRAARRAHDASVRRATVPAGLILASSVFCGVLTVPAEYKGPRNVATIVAVVWFLAELVKMAARNQWRPLRSLPKPRRDVAEATLICIAVLIGGVVGPHVLAGSGDSALASWGLGAAVAAIVAACLFAADVSYRRRSARVWQQ